MKRRSWHIKRKDSQNRLKTKANTKSKARTMIKGRKSMREKETRNKNYDSNSGSIMRRPSSRFWRSTV